MYPNARHHSLYPFLNEIIVREDEAPPYDIEGMDVYPDSEDDYDGHVDCICGDCGKKIKDEYQPPTTRLQARKKQELVAITGKLLESFTIVDYYWFEYMSEQKDYTQEELEKMSSVRYITEERYREVTDNIKHAYEKEKETQDMYNDIHFTQFLMKKYLYYVFTTECIEQYQNNMRETDILKIKIGMITKESSGPRT
tara:strand:+ start:131 stop:721 length:591 start_codon:yes stop_codon:yes gene_type:complete